MAKAKVERVSPRQLLFVEHYMRSWNAADAARQAGYKGRAVVIGWRLMAQPRVRKEVERRVLAITAKLEMSNEEIVEGFVRIARDPRGPKAGGPTHMERMRALSELGKLRGLYVERHMHIGASLEELLLGTTTVEQPSVAGLLEAPATS